MADVSLSGQRLLIVVSDRTAAVGTGRAGVRLVRRWVAGRTDVAVTDGEFRGDPANPATYEWAGRAASVSVVVDMADAAVAAAVLAAVRAVRPDAAGLVLSAQIQAAARDGTLARAGDLRDVVRLDLDDELQRLEAERRVHQLREFAASPGTVPILIHPDPDPDAISSAVAMRSILRGVAAELPIVTMRASTRVENRRMATLLDVRIAEITPAELRRFDRVIAVDSQPAELVRPGVRLAVVDHHPYELAPPAAFADVRPDYGATATILTEYLRADGRRQLGAPLATALLYGIRTDTDGLVRGVTAADVEAYAYLQDHADPALLRRFERPSYPLESARSYGAAIERLAREHEMAAAFAGELDSEQLYVLSDLADFCLGIDGVTWAASAAVVDGELVVALRHIGSAGVGAGEVARALAGPGGRGGGHASMGRVTVAPETRRAWLAGSDDVAQRIAAGVRSAVLAAQADRDESRN